MDMKTNALMKAERLEDNTGEAYLQRKNATVLFSSTQNHSGNTGVCFNRKERPPCVLRGQTADGGLLGPSRGRDTARRWLHTAVAAQACSLPLSSAQ